jgi:hypothetical protein
MGPESPIMGVARPREAADAPVGTGSGLGVGGVIK